MPEWETAGEASDFGTLLMELFAYMGDVMHFYIDRTASEAFLGYGASVSSRCSTSPTCSATPRSVSSRRR